MRDLLLKLVTDMECLDATEKMTREEIEDLLKLGHEIMNLRSAVMGIAFGHDRNLRRATGSRIVMSKSSQDIARDRRRAR
jgi:hypothetical protein